jgi:hypothetical protein
MAWDAWDIVNDSLSQAFSAGQGLVWDAGTPGTVRRVDQGAELPP